jgi:protease-4
MAFLKTLWSIAVGVKDALVLILLLVLFGGLWAAFNATGPAIRVPDGSALLVDLDGVLVDQASDVSPLAALSGNVGLAETEAHDLVRAIDLAAADDRISMVVLDLDGFVGGGLANLQAVGDALGRFRKAGKRVEAFAIGYADDGYFLASHADRIWLDPLGTVAISGPGGNSLYFRSALEKLRVTVEVFRVGTYKSFIEPFTRDDSSAEARAADQALADDLWAVWRAGVQRQRPKLDMAAHATSWPSRVAGANRTQAELSLDSGLVDMLASDMDFRRDLAKRLGAGDEPDLPGDYRRIEADRYLAASAPREPGKAVALVHVSGSIVDGEAPPGGQAGGTSIARQIDRATADPEVAAIVLRVDSGGGSVTASETIRQALLQARVAKKPVVASLGPVAASGGYWVAMAADTVFAQPSTITGSIGVFGIVPTFERTLADLGVSTDGVATTPLSGQPDILGGLNEPTRAIFQGGVGDIYRRFVTLVAEARKLPVAEVEAIAEGRVWSGTRALQLKLVDRHGDLEAAIAEAGRRAGIEGRPPVRVFREEPPFLVRLLSDVGTGAAPPVDALTRQVLASRARAVAQVQTALAVADGPAIQAHCLTCAAHGPPRGRPPKLTDLADLLALGGS